MGEIKPRYGLSGKEIVALNNYWNHYSVQEEWPGNFDRFAKWSAENGWKPLCKLKKIDPTKQHGPGNSYWKPQQEADNGMPAGCPCFDCENKTRDRCSAVCNKRLEFWDMHMAAIRRRYGL